MTPLEGLPSDDTYRFEGLAYTRELFFETSHEIRNLMQSVCGLIELELAKADNPRLRVVMEHALLTGEIASNLLTYARGATDAPGEVKQALDSTLVFFKRRAAQGLRISFESDGILPPVRLPTVYLQLIAFNLIKNALEAMGDASDQRITVTARRQNETVTLDFWNAGQHISAELLPKLFQRFVTTKDAASGTGLGLSVVKHLLQQSGGAIDVENVPTGGVLFRVTVPVAAPAAPEPAKPRAVDSTASLAGRRVLIVDDDGSVRDVLRLIVENLGGGTAQICTSGAEALAILKNPATPVPPFDAIVVDMRMRGMTGAELYEQLPSAIQRKVIFVTGDIKFRQFLSRTGQPALMKPVNYQSLVEAVRKLPVN